MQKLFYLILIICIVIACNSNTGKSLSSTTAFNAKADTTPKYGPMKQYWLVFLLKGESRSQDSAASARIQAAHIKNIERLAAEGKIIMAGPMGYNRDLRGIFIMNCKDSAEAAGYIKTDSAIITGRLRFEIHPWWTAQGTYKFN
jgi:uncharacterized protein YciI